MVVHVLPDNDTLAGYAAGVIARELREGGSLALAGGSTPAATYSALRSHPIPWERIDVWLGDERWVSPDHVDCNARMAIETLGEQITGPLLPIPWSGDALPDELAERYESLLRQRLGGDDGLVHPDLVLLGLGDDCHTASLFPGSPALDVVDREFVANRVVDKGVWRLTATLPLLHRARRIIFLVHGEKKTEALKEVLEGDGATPAARVAAGAADVLWIVDEAAASRLETTPLIRP